MSARPVVIVSAAAVVHAAWTDAVDGAQVFGPDIDRAAWGVTGESIVVLDLPMVAQVRAVLRGDQTARPARCIWLHGEIGPADVRVAWQWGVTDTVPRSTGLAALLALMGDHHDGPRASVLGRIHDPAMVSRLTPDEVRLLDALGAGSTAAQLRGTTGWSRHEVERLRVSALAKLGVHTTGEALAVVRLSQARSAAQASP